MAVTTPRSDDSVVAQERLRLAFSALARSIIRMRGRDSHIAAPGLTMAQYELLGRLEASGPSSAGDLAQAAGLSPATVTQMLDHLAAAGHVERVRSSEDRRVVVTDLTDAGRSALEAKRAHWLPRWEAALAGLSPREMKAAASAMERITAMFDEGPETPDSTGGR
ncbi:MAG TPA: MarR family transcriptional regulator [Solirubrobacteraceae bacterium]|nr:MarR family transcriptional regulator [Solirubrobacteraceae bacterium]